MQGKCEVRSNHKANRAAHFVNMIDEEEQTKDPVKKLSLRWEI